MRYIVILFCFVLASACSEDDGSTKIIGWGDSMLKGSGGKQSIIEIASEEFDMYYRNFAVGGMKSENIALLQGGRPLEIQVEQQTIRASGITGIKILTPEPLNFLAKQEREGRINNVKGTLIRLSKKDSIRNTSGYAFKAKGLSQNLKVQDTVIFTFDNAEKYNNGWMVFWAGRNDIKAGNAIYNTRDNIQAMIDHLGAKGRENYLVLSVCNGIADSEGVGSLPHTEIIKLNEVLQASFGNHFVDLRKYMVEQAIHDMGLIPTEQDKYDMSKDCIPRRFLKDNVHFNTKGYQAAGKFLVETIKAKGWTK